VKFSFRTWQISTTLLLVALAPLLTGSIVMIAAYAPGWIHRGEPVQIGSVLFTFIGFAIPAAYVLGIVPAFLGAAVYCAILTAFPAVRANIAARSIVGFACGGIVGGFWCYAVLGFGPTLYAIAAGVSAATLALRWPREEPKTPATQSASPPPTTT
jgi:hypothetical protein